jgi:hypothetical protein
MLQIESIYEFIYHELTGNEFAVAFFECGIDQASEPTPDLLRIFSTSSGYRALLFADQEPVNVRATQKVIDDLVIPYNFPGLVANKLTDLAHNRVILVVSERSSEVDHFTNPKLYYFYHGFAALDWYRSFHALNAAKKVVREYQHDFVTFNRLIGGDRAYRCYFVAKLIEYGLVEGNQVSFGVSGDDWHDEIANPYSHLSGAAKAKCLEHLPSEPLTIDSLNVPGSASANIPRVTHNALWHVVTETVFHHRKLHLTEKIFKSIVMKQPFILLAAPGNLAYLRSYGFKTFDSLIDESYDEIQDDEKRVDAVVAELVRLCALPENEKRQNLIEIEKVVEHNFTWFYGGFREHISWELLSNFNALCDRIGHNDDAVPYSTLFQALSK